MEADCGIIQLSLDALSPSPPKHPQRLTKRTNQDPRYGNVLWVFFCSEMSGNWREIGVYRSKLNGNEPSQENALG